MARSSKLDNTTILRGTRLPDLPRDTDRLHYLAVIAGDKPGQRVRLGNSSLVIGRSPPADWILPDEEVSRTHCRVTLVLDEVVVLDLESSNGTFIEGKRLAEGSVLPIGARLQIGQHVIEHEWCTRQEVEESQALGQDIQKAGEYIQSLLPPPLVKGALRSDWLLVPSARLGGDTFGYRMLNERQYAIYMVDVSGNGAGAAMHAVSVLNILRRGALPVTDFTNPANVLETLNVMFEMELHGGMSVSVWYGVYDPQARRLSFASAGHHPAFLVPPKRDRVFALETSAPEIGVKRKFQFSAESVDVPPKSVLYVFSDGAFNINTKDGVLGLQDFVPIVVQPPVEGKTEPQRIYDEIRKQSLNEDLEDDFALMAFKFA